MNTIELNAITPEKIESSVSTWRDWLGIVASIGCAIHCAAMPFVIAYLPAWGLSFLADEAFHKWMALICFLIAIVAFIPGLRRHRNWTPISLGAFGLSFITFAAFGLAGECCPSCEAKTASATAGVVSEESESCEHCEDCDNCGANEESSQISLTSASLDAPAEDEKKNDLLSMLAPWLTPTGGLILVSAHLLNRRYGSLCSCCV